MVVVTVAGTVLLAGVVLAAVSLLLRWRRARGVERQQLKWLAYAAAVVAVVLFGAELLPRGLFVLVSTATTLVLPAAIGIAITRERRRCGCGHRTGPKRTRGGWGPYGVEAMSAPCGTISG